MKKCGLIPIFLLFCCFATSSEADTVYMKNGEVIPEVECWEEGSNICFYRLGCLVKTPKEGLLRIESKDVTSDHNYFPKDNTPKIQPIPDVQYEEEELNIVDLPTAREAMIKAVNLCLSVCNRYSVKWRESIEMDFNFETTISIEKYRFRDNGAFRKLEAFKKSISESLQELNANHENAPRVQLRVVQLYGIYSQLHSLALDPTGSLQTFNAKVNDLESEFTRVSNEIEVMIPES